MTKSGVRVLPVTRQRWKDVERLAGERGFYSGCWCMWWRVSANEWSERHGDSLREGLQSIVEADEEPGLLAYEGDKPVGWVAVAPRSQYPRLDRSSKLKPIDERPVWSVTCFYIHRDHRRKGLARELLAAAVEHARTHGAQIVEGYPIDPAGARSVTSASIFTGTLSMFEAAGFREVLRRGDRPIVRLDLR